MAGHQYSSIIVAAPMVETMSRNALDALEPLNAVSVREEIQWHDALLFCFKLNSKYKVSTVPIGLEHMNFNDREMNSFPTLFEVKEDCSPHCGLFCCHIGEMKLNFYPPGTPEKSGSSETEPLMTLHRPPKCTGVHCGKLFGPQQIHIFAKGRKIGHVEQDCKRYKDIGCFFESRAISVDATGQPVHSFYGHQFGANCFAPSCCNPAFIINVVDANDETQRLGWVKTIWPGWTWRSLCKRRASNYVIVFPTNATKEEKALLIGSLFLHDFLIHESSMIVAAGLAAFSTGMIVNAIV